MSQPFQIVGDLGLYYERIAVSLGFATLIAGLATFASCRSLVSLVTRYAHASLLENRAYRSFYKYHAYYWWSLLIIMAIHLASAAMHTGLLPAAGDPDALAHWLILGFAFGSLPSSSIEFASCRSFASLIDFFSQTAR